MARYLKMNPIKNHKGITIVEIVFVASFFLLILIAAYNLFSLSQLSYKNLSEQSLANINAETVIARIDKEVKQARKSTEKNDSLVLITSSELQIYSDITDDDIPELIRYRVVDGKLRRSYAKAKNNKYPYTYGSLGEEITLMESIVNEDIFTEVQPINPDNPKDFRKKIKIHLIVEGNSYTDSNIEIISYLMTRSRVEAD